MKKYIYLFATLLINTLTFAQITRNLGEHKFQDGTEIKEGSKVQLLKGANPQSIGSFMWVYQGGSMPIPKSYPNETFNGKEFVLTKVISLKGIENKDESIIGVFEVEKKKYYCFITQGLKSGELKFY